MSEKIFVAFLAFFAVLTIVAAFPGQINQGQARGWGGHHHSHDGKSDEGHWGHHHQHHGGNWHHNHGDGHYGGWHHHHDETNKGGDWGHHHGPAPQQGNENHHQPLPSHEKPANVPVQQPQRPLIPANGPETNIEQTIAEVFPTNRVDEVESLRPVVDVRVESPSPSRPAGVPSISDAVLTGDYSKIN